ncbi:MAG: hypothetical protein AAF443_09070 [Chlamydiota bacterium]
MVTNFKQLLNSSPGEESPKRKEHKGKTVFLFDRFPIKDKDILIFSIEKTNSKYLQGFSIGVFDGYLKIEGDPTPRRKYANVLFWEDSEALDIKNIEIKVFTESDHICINNIWEIEVFKKEKYFVAENRWGTIQVEQGEKVPCYVDSGEWAKGNCNGAAMYSEDIPNGKRYFCNDGDEDDDFDDIVFSVRKVAPS